MVCTLYNTILNNITPINNIRPTAYTTLFKLVFVFKRKMDKKLQYPISTWAGIKHQTMSSSDVPQFHATK